MLTDNVGAKPTPLKPVATPHTKKPAGNASPTNTPKTATTDNTRPVSEQNETNKDQPQDFDSTFNEKIKTNTNNETQGEKKAKDQNKSDKAVSATSSAQPFALDELIATSSVHGKTGKTASLVSQIAKPDITKSVITKPDITKSVITKPDITKSVITKPDIAKPDITKPDIGMPNITKPDIAKPDIEKPEQIAPENTGKIQTPDNAPVVNDKLIDPDKIAINSSEKPVIKDEPVITSEPKQNQQDGKESTPKTLISNNKTVTDNEQLFDTNKPSVPDSPKTQLSNSTFTAPDQSSNSQRQALFGQEISTQVAEETIPKKADADQKDQSGKTEPFELPEKNKVQAENLSIKSIAQKMSQPQVQPSATQAENRNNLISNQASDPDTNPGEQLLFDNNSQPVIAEQSPASAAFAKIAGNTDSGDSVSSQIQESIHSSFHSGSRQIVVRLNPPELGKVAIKFTEQGENVAGLLQVDKPQTRDQIQQALPEIIQNLQDCGIAIKRLEVVLTNQQEQQTLKDQSSTGQDSWSGHQSSSNPESQRNNTTYNEWLTNIDNAAEYMESQTQFTDNSVNVLI